MTIKTYGMIEAGAVAAPPVEECSGCRYYWSSECRFASPSIGPDGTGRWPRMADGEWCGRWKAPEVRPVAPPKTKRFPDTAIITMVEIAGSVDSDEFTAIVAQAARIHPESARLRVQELVRRRRLREGESGRITIWFDDGTGTLPKARTAAGGGGAGRPKTDHFATVRPLIARYTPESPGRFSEILKTIRETSPISNPTFARLLRAAIDVGAMGKTEGGRYFVVASALAGQKHDDTSRADKTAAEQTREAFVEIETP